MLQVKVNNILGYTLSDQSRRARSFFLIMIMKDILLRLKFKNILSCKKKKIDFETHNDHLHSFFSTFYPFSSIYLFF